METNKVEEKLIKNKKKQHNNYFIKFNFYLDHHNFSFRSSNITISYRQLLNTYQTKTWGCS